MKKTLFINLFGAPGVGKSTAATYIFSRLKMSGIDAEYISEYAKDKCWQENKFVFEKPQNQFYIGAKQFYRCNQLNGKVDVAITDSPLILNSFYNNSEILGENYNNLLFSLSSIFNSYNVLINRVKPYNSNGRNQTENESDLIQQKIKNMLIEKNIIFKEINGDKQSYDYLIDDLFMSKII